MNAVGEKMQYVRLAEGLSDRGKLIPVTEDLYEHINLNKDYYRSIYLYNDAHYKAWKESGTISGITDVTSNWLIFDFDNELGLEDCQRDAAAVCDDLVKYGIPEGSLQIFFSGNKGFSIEVETNKYFTVNEFRNMVYAVGLKYKTFDQRIWNASRLFRLPLTKHQVSGLYKIPLSLGELKTLKVEEIRALASEVEHYDVSALKSYPKADMPDSIYKFKGTATQVEVKKAPVEVVELDFSQKPSWMSKCKYAMSLGYFDPGTRNDSFTVLAATYKSQGFPKNVVLSMLKGVAELQAQNNDQEEFAERELVTITNSVFKPTWNGGTYSCKNPGFLQNYCVEHGFDCNMVVEDDQPFVTTKDVFKKFKDFAQNIEKNTIKLGIPELDSKVRVTTSMLVGLLGSPSSGKTTLALKILHNVGKSGEEGAFYSLDMAEPHIYLKLGQKYTDYNSEDLFKAFSHRREHIEKMHHDGLLTDAEAEDELQKIPEYEERAREVEKVVDQNFGNIKMSFKSAISVESIKRDILAHEELTGKKLRLVVVDYLECLQGDHSDPLANTANIIHKLKDVANRCQVCILLLLQPQKFAGDPREPLLTYRNVKGSSAIEQDCSIIMSCWREGFSPKNNSEDDKFMSIAVLKNRFGSLIQNDFWFDGAKGDIRALTGDESRKLVKLRDRLSQEKKKDDI